jgi:hypothetical protein
LLTPLERSRFSLLLLQLVQCLDQGLAALCGRLLPVVPQPLLRRWATRLGQMKEDGVAGIRDLFQAVEKLLEDAAQVQKSSVLGIVLRRVFLQFDKLTFRQLLGCPFKAYWQQLEETLTRFWNVCENKICSYHTV